MSAEPGASSAGAQRRILLLTNFASDDLCGGAVIVRYWAQRLTAARIEWLSFAHPSGHVPVSAPHVFTRFEWLSMRGNVRLRLAPFWRWYKRAIWSPMVARKLRERLNEFDVVWIVFDYGLIPIVWRLLPDLVDRRVHISLHDDPAFVAQREGCSARFIEEIRRMREALPMLQASFDGVSEELIADIAPPGQPTATVTLPSSDAAARVRLRRPADNGPLRIGFSGNFHGRDEFVAFIAALDRWSRRSGRPWQMVTYGDAALGTLSPNIVAHGPTAPTLVAQGLAKCDLLFLPSPLQRPEMRTNMPTKLVTYLEAAALIVAFAPKGSATERVVRGHHLGPVMNSLDARDIDAAINSALCWNHEAAETGRALLLSHRFNESRIGHDLARQLGFAWLGSNTAPMRL